MTNPRELQFIPVIDKYGMPTCEREPVVYVRDVKGQPGCMVGDVVIDCCNYDTSIIGQQLVRFFESLDTSASWEDSLVFCGNGRLLLRECSAYEIADLLRTQICRDENHALVLFVPTTR